MIMSKSRAKREKYAMEEFMKVKPMQAVKRRAKLNVAAKIPGLATGLDQGANGPFQDQETTAVQTPKDQSKSENSTSSSEDTETEDVDIDSESEYEVLPRSAVRAAADELINKFHAVLNKGQTRRRKKADEADKKAKQTEAVKIVEASEASDKLVEVQTVRQDEIVMKTISKQKHEVVIVGTLRFMPTD